MHNVLIGAVDLDVYIVREPDLGGDKYPVGSPLTLTAGISGDYTAPLSYQWTSTCDGECFVAGGSTKSLNRYALRSVDSGWHTCVVTDYLGNSGTAQTIINATGVLYIVG